MRRIGLLTLISLLLPLSAYAALININTADATLLDTLPGIGPTYATRIVDYRTAHGPFVQISDLQNVSGIGPSTYANVKDLITVGVASDPAPVASSTPPSSDTPVQGAVSTYVPPPSALTFSISGDHTAFQETPLHLTARVTSKSGVIDPSAQISWSFGDGSSAVGNEVEKVYRYPGTYAVMVFATNAIAKASDEVIITVVPAQVHIVSIASEGVTIANGSKERLDLSFWRLASDVGSFRFPEGTILLPESKVLFPSAITNLPVTLEVSLLYPNGITATRFAPTPVQPVLASASFNQVQKVEEIISPKPEQAYENKAVIAPAPVSIKETGAGASLDPVPELAGAAAAPEAPKTAAGGLFHSVWSYGLLGVIALAGGAFILL